MPTLVYPQNAELRKIEQSLLPTLTQDDPIFDIMPIETSDAATVMWEQEDDYVGLQQIRGLNGAPQTVKNVGGKRFIIEPGIYGEVATVDEIEITMRRGYGTFAESIDISDLVRKRQDQLLTREIARLRFIGWTLVSTGTFSINGPDGLVYHTDTFPLQTFSAGVAWSTVATATPLKDFRSVKLLQRGYSVSFGRQAKAYANSTTVNNMLNNTNAADIGGKRRGGGDTFNSLADMNQILLDNDLPMIVEYDKGYKNDAGTWTNYLADGKVVVVGAREDGGRVAGYQMTRNANNPNFGGGAYVKVVDDENAVPRNVQVHRGHNGGPAFYYPSAVVIMSV